MCRLWRFLKGVFPIRYISAMETTTADKNSTKNPPSDPVDSTKNLPSDPVVPTKNPPADPVEPTNISPSDPVGPMKNPSSDPVEPTKNPSADLVELMKNPPADLVKPTNIPSSDLVESVNDPLVNPVEPTNIPSSDPVEPMNDPLVNPVEPTNIPASDTVEPTNIPASDHVASASNPLPDPVEPVNNPPRHESHKNTGWSSWITKKENKKPKRLDYSKMPLEKKRSHYRCGNYYVTLDQVQPWPDYVKDSHYSFTKKGLLQKDSEFTTDNDHINRKVSLWLGDITQLEIDAIVNDANKSLLGGSGGQKLPAK
ncbi:Hypothetical predicted protein, partial [Paramuricea clavata]